MLWTTSALLLLLHVSAQSKTTTAATTTTSAFETTTRSTIPISSHRFNPFPTPSQGPVPHVHPDTDPSNPPPPGNNAIPYFGAAWAEARRKAENKVRLCFALSLWLRPFFRCFICFHGGSWCLPRMTDFRTRIVSVHLISSGTPSVLPRSCQMLRKYPPVSIHLWIYCRELVEIAKKTPRRRKMCFPI